MKKLVTSTIIVLCVGLAMIFVGSVLGGINWSSDFDGTELAGALVNIGYIAAALSGIVLTGFCVSLAVRGEEKK